MSETILQTKNLKKYFNTKDGLLHAVDGVDLSIDYGQTLGVVGESGCGKSTLGRLIVKLLEESDGEIIFNGKDITKCKRRDMKNIRRDIQLIFQDPYASLDPRKSVGAIISEPLVVNGLVKNKKELNMKVKELMDTVGLAERLINSYPHELDGGRRQRIGIARALALNPKFIVCDEPVSALDLSIQAQILNLLMELQKNMDLSYMFITHDLSVVKHISDKIAVMYLGQCVENATSDELFNDPKHPYTKALLGAIPKIDPYRKEKVKIIRGEVTSPINPKPGCRFAPRCDYATDKCTSGNIPLKEISKGHFVACSLYQ